MNIDDAVHGLSTIIIATASSNVVQGTGFFYQEFGQKDLTKDAQWVPIEKVWLVTNRHVVLPRINGHENIPETITFNLRKINGDKIEWDPVTIKSNELLARAKFHINARIDICIIEILDLLTKKISSGAQYLQWYGVSKENLPGSNKIYPEVASDAVVIGYPRGFYDQVNLYPIVKSGIIASRWGASFNGNPYFLIDAKLFPGSSGSVVISKPSSIAYEGGQIFYNKEKQFAFLGVFSGEPYQEHQPIELDDLTIIRKSGYNVGVVWYSYLIEEIIQGGQKLKSVS